MNHACTITVSAVSSTATIFPAINILPMCPNPKCTQAAGILCERLRTTVDRLFTVPLWMLWGGDQSSSYPHDIPRIAPFLGWNPPFLCFLIFLSTTTAGSSWRCSIFCAKAIAFCQKVIPSFLTTSRGHFHGAFCGRHGLFVVNSIVN